MRLLAGDLRDPLYFFAFPPTRVAESCHGACGSDAAATIFANVVFSVYICIGIVTGNSERADNPLKSFLIRAPSKSRSLGGFLFYPFYELFIESPSEGCETGAFMQKSGIFA